MSVFTNYSAWPISSSNQTGGGSDTAITTDDSTHVLTAGSTFTVSGAVGGLANGTYTYEGAATARVDGLASSGFYAQDPQNHSVYFTSEAVGAGETAAENPGDSFDLSNPPPPPCFAMGSRLAGPNGEIAVEDLHIGDSLLTAAGEAKPIVWIGRSRVDCRRHPNPNSVHPVRVRAGAFAPDVPRRDLLLSPGHAVFAEGVLIPVCHLINGISILREDDARKVTYYHVELPAHEVLLAEGLPTESYLDDGNRGAFDNGGSYRVLHPDYTPKTWDGARAPKCEGGEKLAVVKRCLRVRLEEWGYRLKTEGGIEVFAGGARLVPQFASGGLKHFLIPPGADEVRIVSPRGMPAALFDESSDIRWLGAQIALVLLEGEWIRIDSPMLANGFYAPERDASGTWRWTNGDAKLRLPLSGAPRLLVLFVRDVMRTWIAPEQEATSSAAAA